MFRLFTIAVFVSFLCSGCIYNAAYKANERNITNVKVGMTEQQMLNIMGTAGQRNTNGRTGALYVYNTNDGDFRPIEIRIDTNRFVTEIYIPGPPVN